MNKLKGWRTIIINGATLVVVIAGALSGTIDDPAILQWMLIATAVSNALMRWVTTTAVGKAE